MFIEHDASELSLLYGDLGAELVGGLFSGWFSSEERLKLSFLAKKSIKIEVFDGFERKTHQ